MFPEQLARQNIDNLLAQCRDMNITAGPGVAVREFPLKTGFADYLLCLDGKASGVIEAKPEGHSLTGVEIQSAKYTSGLPKTVPHYCLPLPFAWESTGADTRFTNTLEPNARSREVFSFHRPGELRRLVRQESQLRANLRDMPELDTTGLWDVQVRAITNLEKSLSDNNPRALVQMATGSGKTFTVLVIFCVQAIQALATLPQPDVFHLEGRTLETAL
ncbi:MAG: DEAD/DEAH box helicase family protein [Planctomycetaceae bacterium]